MSYKPVRMDHTIGVRLTRDEKDAWKKAAKKRQQCLGDFVRDIIGKFLTSGR